MTLRGFSLSGLVASALLAGGCSSGSNAPPCTPVSGGATAFSTLDQWCQVSLVDGDIAVMAGVTPYELNTPLFSDYAVKRRTVWVPSGSATYDATEVFDFPDGTVFTKSFGFADDMRKANPILTWVETRVIWKTAGTWQGISYTWDAAQKTATANPGGEVVSLSWIDASGQPVSTDGYLVPAVTQCSECHDASNVFAPIGPKARNLNRDETYPDGTTQNQLEYWTSKGFLSGAPSDPSTAPKLAVWNDASTGTLNDRARAYLESNCAHCHSPTGYALNTGLYLSTFETNTTNLGFCKKPVAAGQGGCGLTYDIVPGDPTNSIAHCRLDSTVEAVRMPEIGRSLVDVDGLQLITDWITSLPGGCP